MGSDREGAGEAGEAVTALPWSLTDHLTPRDCYAIAMAFSGPRGDETKLRIELRARLQLAHKRLLAEQA